LIVSFRHNGLARLYEHGSARGLSPALVPKIERILARLDVALDPGQMNLPGWRLHPLKGQWKGFWSVWVSANWRIIFRFRWRDVCDVHLVDYH
jgi:proteic killer suppression protein